MDLAGKVAIVTGAGRGFGRAIALALADGGCQLSLAARSADQLVAVATAVQAAGQQALAVATDVTDESAVTVLVERTRAVFGRIDVLVNAAAAASDEAFVATAPPLWHDLVATNLTGPYLCAHAVAPIMQANGGGSILSVVCRRAARPDGRRSATAAAQAGLLGLTRALAVELEPASIRVNALCAGDAADPGEVAPAALFLAGAATITGQVIEIR